MISLQHPAFERESLRLKCRRPKQTPTPNARPEPQPGVLTEMRLSDRDTLLLAATTVRDKHPRSGN